MVGCDMDRLQCKTAGYSDNKQTSCNSASVLLCAAVMLTCLACRQTAVRPGQQEFAVEGPTGHYVVVVPGLSTEIPAAALEPLRGEVPSIELDTLKIDYRLEGDKVIATVYALNAPRGNPERYGDSNKHLLGVHSARLNQTFTLKELENFKYEPITYKVVTAKPPTPTHPRLTSKVPSIQIEIASEDRAFYKLVLRNVSEKDVIAYKIGGTSSESYNTAHPVIAAGSAIEREAAVGSPIYLAAAIFGDGTYQGDSEVACLLYAQQVGYEAQRKRLDASIDRIVSDSLDDAAKIAKIQAELMKLPKEPDAQMVQNLQRHFPGLAMELVREYLALGLDQAIREIWGSLYEFEHQNAVYPKPASHPPVAQWWRSQPAVRNIFSAGRPLR
jgi:hypothetical protein